MQKNIPKTKKITEKVFQERIKSRNHVFTFFHQGNQQAIEYIKSIDVKYLQFGEEVCPLTKNVHLQGFLILKNEAGSNFVLDMLTFKNNDLIIKPWTKIMAEKADYIHNLKYTSKDNIVFSKGICPQSKYDQGKNGKIANDIWAELDSDIISGLSKKELMQKYSKLSGMYVSGFNSHYEMFKPKKVRPVNITLREWQNDLIKIFDSEVKHRTIYWLWSEASDTGKTTFKKYCETKYSVLDVNNFNWKEIVYTYDDHKIIWLNFSREDSINANILKILEKLSDGGNAQSTKYQKDEKYIDSHIIVTTNQSPFQPCEDYKNKSIIDRLPKRIVSINIDEKSNDICNLFKS